MDELKEVKRALNPTEVLLVVDAMTGQEAAGVQTFLLFKSYCAISIAMDLYSYVISFLMYM